MRTRALLPLLALGLGLGVLAATAAPPVEKPDKPDADKIAKLIVQLGSDDFDEREKASADLEAVGDPAYAALHEALKSADEEVRKRAELLVGKIEKRRESADALKPKRVHLVYKDVPLAEAVEDLKKQTGYNITLSYRQQTQDPQGHAGHRRRDILASAGPVLRKGGPAGDGEARRTGWPHRSRFPRRTLARGGFGISRAGRRRPAGRPARTAARRPGNAASTASAAPAAAWHRHRRPGLPTGRPHDGGPRRHHADGRQGGQPSDRRLALAVRVQALKPDPNTPTPDGEILIGLRLSIEPRMLFQSVEKVTIRKAVDDQKQELAQTTTHAAWQRVDVPARAGRAIIMPFPGAGVALGAGDIQQEAVST